MSFIVAYVSRILAKSTLLLMIEAIESVAFCSKTFSNFLQEIFTIFFGSFGHDGPFGG